MRNAEGPPTVFGVHAVSEVVEQRPGEVDRIYFDREARSSALFALLKTCRRLRLPYQMVPRERLDQLAPAGKHQGVVASCPAKAYAPIEEVLSQLASCERPLVLVPASVEDPRNLGAIIRSCVAFGVHALLLEQHNTTQLSALVAKASAGMLEHLPVARPRNLEGVVKGLKDAGYAVVGMEAGAAKRPGDVTFAGPTVIIAGGENRGIPPYLRKLCTDVVGIPIEAVANSLNVSVAVGILLYECGRQRAIS